MALPVYCVDPLMPGQCKAAIVLANTAFILPRLRDAGTFRYAIFCIPRNSGACTASLLHCPDTAPGVKKKHQGMRKCSARATTEQGELQALSAPGFSTSRQSGLDCGCAGKMVMSPYPPVLAHTSKRSSHPACLPLLSAIKVTGAPLSTINTLPTGYSAPPFARKDN